MFRTYPVAGRKNIFAVNGFSHESDRIKYNLIHAAAGNIACSADIDVTHIKATDSSVVFDTVVDTQATKKKITAETLFIKNADFYNVDFTVATIVATGRVRFFNCTGTISSTHASEIVIDQNCTAVALCN